MQTTNPKPFIDSVIGQRNQPNGFVGIESDGSVLGTFASRRGTYDDISQVVLANGELAFTTDTKDTFVGDGVTAGGIFLHSQPKFVAGGKNNHIIGAAPPSPSDIISWENCSPGVYHFSIDVWFFVNNSGDPSRVFIWPLPSDWRVNPPLPYPPGLTPDGIFARWYWSFNNGFNDGSEVSYLSTPIKSPGTNATSNPLYGNEGRITGYMYHNDGPYDAVSIAGLPERAFSFLLLRAGGGSDIDLNYRIYGHFQRIK